MWLQSGIKWLVGMTDSSSYPAESTCPGGQNCPCQQLHEVLSKNFGYSDFLPGQKEAALSILHKRDVFVRMATGAGKSLCMFLGPLCTDNAMGFIISPLNALMQQQV